MEERGIKSRLTQRYLIATSVQCLVTSGSEFSRLKVTDLFTALGIMGFSFLSSPILLVAELVHARFKRKNMGTTGFRNLNFFNFHR